MLSYHAAATKAITVETQTASTTAAHNGQGRSSRKHPYTVKLLWYQRPVPTQHQLELGTYHTDPERYQARLQGIKLYYQGWNKLSISCFLQVSRPTVDTWIARFEAEHLAGLLDKKRGPKEPPRTVWFPRMVQGYHLQQAHPDAGEFRIWSLVAWH